MYFMALNTEYYTFPRKCHKKQVLYFIIMSQPFNLICHIFIFGTPYPFPKIKVYEALSTFKSNTYFADIASSISFKNSFSLIFFSMSIFSKCIKNDKYIATEIPGTCDI